MAIAEVKLLVEGRCAGEEQQVRRGLYVSFFIFIFHKNGLEVGRTAAGSHVQWTGSKTKLQSIMDESIDELESGNWLIGWNHVACIQDDRIDEIVHLFHITGQDAVDDERLTMGLAILLTALPAHVSVRILGQRIRHDEIHIAAETRKRIKLHASSRRPFRSASLRTYL